MSLLDPDSDVVVTSIAFSDGSMEISYIEKREQTESVGMMRTLFVDIYKAGVKRQHGEMIELAVDVVENALLVMRNPEQSLDPRKRFRSRPKPEEPDEDIQGS